MVRQLGALVENLLQMARLDQGEAAVLESEIELNELVAECWASHSVLATKRGLRFRNEVPATVKLRSDPEKMRIVVNNLLANAAEYTERGGWVEVTSGPSVLAIADSGPAIPRESLDRIFDRFWRGDRARSGNGAHCGIGLALSRSLCERLALDLTADSLPDGSVVFRIVARGQDQAFQLEHPAP